MKATLLISSLLLLVSCMGGTSSGQIQDAQIDSLLLDHSWRTTVSCDGTPECTFKTISFGADAVTITDYKKADPVSAIVTQTIKQEDFDFEAVETRVGLATSRVDANIKMFIVATQLNAGQMRICIDSSCANYDQINHGDL